MSTPSDKTPVICVGILVFKDDQILLVKRRNPPNQGAWTIPGGKQKFGETLIEAARREIFEETGIVFNAPIMVDALDLMGGHEEDQPLYHYTVVEIAGLYESGTLRAASDAEQVCWANINHLNDFALDTTSLEVIKKAHGLINVP